MIAELIKEDEPICDNLTDPLWTRVSNCMIGNSWYVVIRKLAEVVGNNESIIKSAITDKCREQL